MTEAIAHTGLPIILVSAENEVYIDTDVMNAALG